MFLKKRNQNKGYFMNHYFNFLYRGRLYNINEKRSLQAQFITPITQERKRTSCLASCKGSVTVETALILPIFLCAFCTIVMLGQMAITEAEIQHAVSKTAFICARQEALKENSQEERKEDGQEKETMQSNKNALGTILGTSAAFYSVFQDSSGVTSCIYGGKWGMRLSAKNSSEEMVEVSAEYNLKVPIPFFQGIYFHKIATAKERIFSGYVEHEGDNEGKENDQIVYIAENGTVYHTSLSCTHISIHITGGTAVNNIVESSRYQPCEKCIKENEVPEQLYVTPYGDCYHSTLHCSGLKRTVKAVRLSEIEGMRMCTRCAANSFVP